MFCSVNDRTRCTIAYHQCRKGKNLKLMSRVITGYPLPREQDEDSGLGYEHEAATYRINNTGSVVTGQHTNICDSAASTSMQTPMSLSPQTHDRGTGPLLVRETSNPVFQTPQLVSSTCNHKAMSNSTNSIQSHNQTVAHLKHNNTIKQFKHLKRRLNMLSTRSEHSSILLLSPIVQHQHITETDSQRPAKKQATLKKKSLNVKRLMCPKSPLLGKLRQVSLFAFCYSFCKLIISIYCKMNHVV